jgi:putative colanic acid biosynthesis acetyltransferase WcaF
VSEQISSGIRIRNNQSSTYGLRNKAARALWGGVWMFLFRPSPWFCHGWRRFLLALFGAKLASTARVSNSVVIWAPWNLVMDDSAEIGPDVDCYSVAMIHIGAHATVSQYCYLCAGSRDTSAPDFRPTKAPITIADQAWLGADVFVGPGVNVGQGAVVGARSTVFTDVPAWTISSGNPAQVLQKRILTNDSNRNHA